MSTIRLKRISTSSTLDFFTPDFTDELELPLIEVGVSAGFPSPAEDFEQVTLKLSDLIKHPAATFYARAKGDSMINAGIQDGDLLVIDKALEPKNGRIAVCYLDGDFTVKRVALLADGLYLMPANEKYKPIKISDESDFRVWGIVMLIIHNAL